MTRIADALRIHAIANPDGIAIDAGQAGAVRWSEIAGRAEALAARLIASMDPARAVAVDMDHGIANCIADIALLEAGFSPVLLPPFFSPAQRAHVLAHAGVQAVLSAGTDDEVLIAPQDQPRVELPAGTAKISFTSGSTGAPKGICLSAEHMLTVASAVVDYLGAESAGRHLALLPPAVLLENVAGFYASILAGGTYVALPAAEAGLANPFMPDFRRMAATIAEQRITSLILVPENLRGIVAVLQASGMRLPDLTLVAVGGARVAPELVAQARALGLPVRQGYGMTECASVVTLEEDAIGEPGNVGRSIGANRITLAEDGEILIDGPVCLGAIGAPRSAGPLHTGDIGRIDSEGRLHIGGRKSNLIITAHGRNVSPEWPESVLTAQDAIAQAMVHGDGAAELGALIVPAAPAAEVVRAVADANAQLPAYARIGRWRLAMPFTPANGQLTANGRLRRDAIAQTYLKEKDDMGFFDRLAAETETERAALARVPQLQAGLAGHISRHTYIAYLTQAYHHVRHTVPLMQAAHARMTHNPMLLAALDEYIEEESGHEAWILSDIAAAGGDADDAAASAPHPATQAMVDHAFDAIRNGNPAAFFGMVYVLEGTSVALATAGAGAVQRSLGLPDNAFSYLTSHGSLDLDHMRFFADLMNRIDDPLDQQAIIRMARDMFRLFAAMFAAIPMENVDAAA